MAGCKVRRATYEVVRNLTHLRRKVRWPIAQRRASDQIELQGRVIGRGDLDFVHTNTRDVLHGASNNVNELARLGGFHDDSLVPQVTYSIAIDAYIDADSVRVILEQATQR